MNKLVFKVVLKEQESITSLIKQVNKISCRIYIDLEQGIVRIENVDDTMIETVIELVEKYYSIFGVEIDNISEKDEVKNFSDDALSGEEENASQQVVERQPKTLEPQSEEDLIIEKVEFRNEYVEGIINKFIRTAYWAMFKMNAPEKEIGQFIYTCIDEISMAYNEKPIIDFAIGDIVDCNYGTHLKGEICGSHVHGIVCNICNDVVYVVPITKATGNAIFSNSYLEFSSPKDVVYNTDYYKGGTALLDKAKYIRAERLNSVVGKTTTEFFERLLQQLVPTFDFTDSLSKALEEEFKEGNDEVVEDITEEVESVDEKSYTKKVGEEEKTLLELIGKALDKLDKLQPIPRQAYNFIVEIGMNNSSALLAQSFVIACNINKINYENVVLELHELSPNIKEEIIRASLKEDFKSWLGKYPELVAKCPKISLMSVLKVFAKRFA